MRDGRRAGELFGRFRVSSTQIDATWPCFSQHGRVNSPVIRFLYVNFFVFVLPPNTASTAGNHFPLINRPLPYSTLIGPHPRLSVRYPPP
eukprot:7051047-Pyramimonas_sp.AAC.3